MLMERRRRRLTLAPEMRSGGGGSGSHFAVLSPLEEGETE